MKLTRKTKKTVSSMKMIGLSLEIVFPPSKIQGKNWISGKLSKIILERICRK